MATDRPDTVAGALGAPELRRALAGRHPTVSADAALDQVSRMVDLPTRTGILRSVLADPGQSATLRQTAARHLANIDRPEAARALVDGLRIREPLVRGAVLRGLGRVGGADLLPRVRRLRGLRGWVAREASFATTLLAYRHGVEGHEVHAPRGGFLDPDPRRFGELRVRPADHHEHEAIARSITVERLGVPVATDHAYRMICGPRHLLIVLNRDLIDAGDLGETLARPVVPALVLHRHHHDDTYVPIFYLLADPSPRSSGRVRLAVLTAGGRLCCIGSATIGERLATFSVRAVAGLGNTPARVEGTFERGALTLTDARVGLAIPRSGRVAAGAG
jgi:hypothetical protein